MESEISDSEYEAEYHAREMHTTKYGRGGEQWSYATDVAKKEAETLRSIDRCPLMSGVVSV